MTHATPNLLLHVTDRHQHPPQVRAIFFPTSRFSIFRFKSSRFRSKRVRGQNVSFGVILESRNRPRVFFHSQDKSYNSKCSTNQEKWLGKGNSLDTKSSPAIASSCSLVNSLTKFGEKTLMGALGPVTRK